MNEHTFEAFYEAEHIQRTIRTLMAQIKNDKLFADVPGDLLQNLVQAAYLHGWSDAVAVVKQ